MANLYDGTYRSADETKYAEHDNALLDAQIALLKQVKSTSSPTVAAKYAEAYALISGKTVLPPVEVKQA
ncbi:MULTISPECIES: hypothetical protein [Paenarthrobacter]|uniref:Uncharacterized protein n=1 Tax=Paenarthrobacter ureafaciens TaxID=37931 RepID=A0AAX3EKC0_PAEUR|nr:MULTISPECIES: hypothetical protein [Paenarthrobacter]MDO5863422.1 hypothetical protein [Paenarthrobacter sp. SD-2]MDO5874491.1 hypothetical protein [Paenarthrobacter sp. SD-1]QMU81424.1 hypothetical protein FV140_04150 [Paenarthrobacter ureafaciens]UYV93897.1 hypothetical protein NL395_04185 [Paenarthrobacter ureafaciens]UYV98423.1 hypothetical protein NL394_04125 [Paenarthrobacter ureafaciens]